MKVFDLHDQNGKFYAFEVNNGLFGRRAACKVARSIPGVKIIKKLSLFSLFGEEVFFKFELNGVRFNIWEPFNDSSRFWIGPESAKPHS
ncbi:MAG: hypothetical protein HWE26_06715 [Alteromonadaceae bacterium]|nr:hypothetical protein [Alteromonadaceae bacterium]